jgi:hypothetical protein
MSVGCSLRRNPIESHPAVLKLNPLLQTRDGCRIRLMPHAHQILALNFR